MNFRDAQDATSILSSSSGDLRSLRDAAEIARDEAATGVCVAAMAEVAVAAQIQVLAIRIDRAFERVQAIRQFDKADAQRRAVLLQQLKQLEAQRAALLAQQAQANAIMQALGKLAS